ncbi:hypothetical protein FACS189485_12030 [Spirochaetia bacterium]|nr:hypothetical protein FACS189485_12030 [Spirochaetia bacterium]
MWLLAITFTALAFAVRAAAATVIFWPFPGVVTAVKPVMVTFVLLVRVTVPPVRLLNPGVPVMVNCDRARLAYGANLPPVSVMVSVSLPAAEAKSADVTGFTPPPLTSPPPAVAVVAGAARKGKDRSDEGKRPAEGIRPLGRNQRPP